MRRPAARLIVVAVFFLQAAGCSLYLKRPVTFYVHDAETKEPIKGAELEASYLAMMDFGVLLPPWGPMKGFTDAEGKVKLVIDPRKAELGVDANADGYHEPCFTGSIIQKKQVSRGAFGWRSDCVLEIYKNPEAKLTLLLPNDYRGVLALHFASQDSPPVPAGNREFIYEASENGRVQIKETGLIERVCNYNHFHSRYRNGLEIPTVVDAGTSNVAANSIALRFITPVWEDHIWVYVVGTKADADKVHEAIWGDGNHFNRPLYLRLIADH